MFLLCFTADRKPNKGNKRAEGTVIQKVTFCGTGRSLFCFVKRRVVLHLTQQQAPLLSLIICTSLQEYIAMMEKSKCPVCIASSGVLARKVVSSFTSAPLSQYWTHSHDFLSSICYFNSLISKCFVLQKGHVFSFVLISYITCCCPVSIIVPRKVLVGEGPITEVL